MKEVDEITLTFKKGVELVKVSERSGATNSVRMVAPATLSRLFTGTMSTGFLPVSHDGICYVAKEKDYTVVVAQRAEKKMKINWNDTNTIDAWTPYTVGIFGLHPLDAHYKLSYHKIFALKNALTSLNDECFDMPTVGNFYVENAGANASYNVCWGTGTATAGRAGSKVSLGSLINILNDFYVMPFNNHVHGNITTWQKADKSPLPLLATKARYTVQEGVNQAINFGMRR